MRYREGLSCIEPRATLALHEGSEYDVAETDLLPSFKSGLPPIFSFSFFSRKGDSLKLVFPYRSLAHTCSLFVVS